MREKTIEYYTCLIFYIASVRRLESPPEAAIRLKGWASNNQSLVIKLEGIYKKINEPGVELASVFGVSGEEVLEYYREFFEVYNNL